MSNCIYLSYKGNCMSDFNYLSWWMWSLIMISLVLIMTFLCLTFTLHNCSAFPPYRSDSTCDILDLILSKNDSDGDSSSQVGFLCGSPPIRADNPVIHDPQFGKRLPSFSPLGGSSYGKMPAVRVEVGSPSCGVSSSPKVRIEGFACGNSETHYAVTFVWAFRWYVPDFALRPTAPCESPWWCAGY